ncbi:DnaJ-class molecular chaperone [Aureimonas jatrophae]|nr:DnaJ-class molecular chaperone [Aureimonas jatrophae]
MSDKEKRAQFDRGEIDAEGKPRFQGFAGGENPFASAGRNTGSGSFDFRSSGNRFGGGDGLFSDFFDQAFGGRRAADSGFNAARNTPSKGEDIRATLKIRLEDAVSDEKVEAVFPNGKRLAIRLPPGVEDGQVIRLRGQGQPAVFAGGPAGDALVTIAFAEHPRFKVAGHDLELSQSVHLSDAVLGGRIMIETLDGRVTTRIQPWTNSGRTLRLKGKGLTRKDNTRGDILVTLQISLPAEPDAELIALMEKRQATVE